VSADPSPAHALVATEDDVAALIDALRPVPVVAFDLEFLSQERYAPTLCLIQLGWRAGDHVEVRLVDPLATSVRPVLELLADGRTVLAHGARQDAGLVAAQYGMRIAGLFDTQIAAAFTGMGDQIGYARLAGTLVGASIDKDAQWTDWDRRPLSARQLRYAVADVAHLPAIHELLVARLGARVPWVLAESAAMVEEAWAAAQLAGDDAWRAIGAARALDRDQLAALIELAAWRQRTAATEDTPIGRVLAEKTLVELARARPRDERALRQVRGAGPDVRDRAAPILAAIAAGAVRAATGDVPATVAAAGPSTPRAELWTDLVLALVAAAADATGIAPRFLATRADAEALARAVDRAGGLDGIAHPLLASWRREVVGDRIARWFRGDVALAADLTGSTGIVLRDTSAAADLGRKTDPPAT
jgi:ribonuclease D